MFSTDEQIGVELAREPYGLRNKRKGALGGHRRGAHLVENEWYGIEDLDGWDDELGLRRRFAMRYARRGEKLREKGDCGHVLCPEAC